MNPADLQRHHQVSTPQPVAETVIKLGSDIHGPVRKKFANADDPLFLSGLVKLTLRICVVSNIKSDRSHVVFILF